MKLNNFSSWDDISLEQFIDLVNIDPNLSIFDRGIEILSILNNVEYDDEMWDSITFTQMNNEISKYNWLLTEPAQTHVPEIFEYTYKDINKVTLAEFIDIDYFMNTETKFEHIDKVIAILYRRKRINEWGVEEIEPYSYDVNERAELFKPVPISKKYGITKAYHSFKKMINDNYQLLFEPNYDDIEEDEDYIADAEDKELERLEALNKKWGWENVLWKLSGGDITKYESILEMPFIFVMNQLSFQKDMKL